MVRRIPNTVGGGSQTNVNGLAFEGRTDLLESLNNHRDITIIANNVFKNGILIGEYYEKYNFYSNYLSPNGINWQNILSKQYLPDSVFVNINNSTIYIIEKKYQASSGSVDEKLQTCDFKKKVYQKLLHRLNVTVEYYYLLNEWFEQPAYDDVFSYIESVGCKKFINFIPFEELGIE